MKAGRDDWAARKRERFKKKKKKDNLKSANAVKLLVLCLRPPPHRRAGILRRGFSIKNISLE